MTQQTTLPGIPAPESYPFLPVHPELSTAINELCAIVNDWAEQKLWNEDPLAGIEMPDAIRKRLQTALRLEQVALMHTELSECVEFQRAKVQPAMDDHVPELTGEEAEMADLVIRVFHYCGKHGINLGEAVRKKHAYNITRPIKHGKSV